MPSTYDIFNDKSKYPDNMEWTLPSGEKTTVGDWRSDMRSTFMPKDDFTRGQQRAAQERQQLEAAYQQQLYTAQQQMALLQQQAARSGQASPATGDDLDTFLNDPTFAPLAKKTKAALDRLEQAEARLSEQQARLNKQEETWWLNQHAQVLSRIQDKDADFKDPNKVNEFLTFAKQHQLANLDQAHRLFTRDRDLERERETARKEAYERAKTELSAPHIPTGANQAPGTSAPNAPTPASPDEAEAMANNDPTIARLFEQVA